MEYRYQPLSQNMLSTHPHSIFRLLDKEKNEIFEMSPWDIICANDVIIEINPKYYAMICAAASDNGVKDRQDIS